MGKKYTTNFLEDTNGSTGASNQVLISTPTGIDWVDGSGSSIIGGPYVTIGTTQTITGTKTFAGSININSNQILNLKNVDNTNGFQLYNSGATGATNANLILLSGAVGERMRIDSLGRVGIGTTSPSSRLTVSGPATPSLANGENSIRIERHASAAASPGVIGNGINFAQKWWSGSAGLQVTGGIYGIKNAANGTYGGGLAFYTQPSSASDMAQRMIIDTVGNVGIGVEDPEKKLEVKSDTTYDGIMIDVLSAPEITFRDRGNSDTRVGTGRHGLDGFHIDTYSGNALFIKGSNRFVGIGTTLPNDALEVAGNNSTQHRIRINNAGTGTATLAFMQGTTFKSWVEYNNSTGNLDVWQYTNNPLRFATNNTERMRIDSSGQLMVGTTTPRGFTTIEQGDVNTVGLVVNSTSATYSPKLYLRDQGGAGFSEIQANNDLYINAANVGIGVTGPDSKLTVSSGTANNVANFKSTDGTAYIAISDNSSSSALGNQVGVVGDQMYFAVGDVERMRLVPDGDSTFVIIKAKPATYNSKSFITLYGTNSSTYGGSVIARSSISSETDGSAYGANLKFYTNDSSNVEQTRFQISSNGVGYFYNNFYLAAASNEGNLFFGTADASYKIFGGGTYGYMGYDTGGYHRFLTSGSERMRINSQGQTWLGGSYTGADIANGNAAYLNNLNAGGFSVLHRNAADVYLHFNTYYNSSNNYTAKYGGSQGFRIDNGATGGLGFYKAPVVNTAGDTQTFSHVMQVGYGTSNNVGIGITLPQQKLHVNGNLRVGTDTGFIDFARPGGAIVGGIGWHTNNYFYVAGHPTAGTGAGNNVRVYAFGALLSLGNPTVGDALTVAVNGNIGIGLTNPTTHLEVVSSQTNSSIRAGALEMQSYAVNNSWYAENLYYNGGWRLRSAGYATQMYMQDSKITFNRFATGNAGDFVTPVQTMVLNSNGKVGINETSPSAQLQVTSTGGNGGAGYSDYGILTTAGGGNQATIGVMHDGDGYANLNLGSNVSGLNVFWHISKRTSGSANLGGNNGLDFWYNNGYGFTNVFGFSTTGYLKAADGATFGGTVTAGSGSQAANNDAMLTLRASAFSGLDIKSARTTGNIGGIRFYDTASDTVPEAQLNVEVDGSYNFYNGTNGAQLRLKIDSSGNATFAGDVFSDGLYVNTTSAVAGTQVAIVQDGAQNLQRWGSTSDGSSQASYRFRIDQNFEFIGNSGSADTITLKSSDGSATFAGDVTVKGSHLYIWGDNTAVAGSIQAYTSNGGLYLEASGTNQNIGLIPSGTGTVNLTGDGVFSKNAKFTDGAAYSSAASIRQQSNNLIFSGGSDGYYFNKSDNSATHFRIDSVGNSTFAGDVTVSKASPTLEISSTSGGTAQIIIGRTLDTKARIKSGDQLAGDLTFSTGGTRRLMINNSGAAKFAGTLGVSGKDPVYGLTLPQGSGSGNKIAWTDSTTTFAASIYANNTNDKLTFATKNASNAETVALEIDISQNATFAGDISTSTVQISNGTSYNENIRMFPSTSNDYSSLILGAVSGTSGTGYGQWSLVRYPYATHSHKFSIRHSSADIMVMTTGGDTTFVGTVNVGTKIGLPDGGDLFWDGGYSVNKPVLAANGTTMKMYPSGASGGVQFSLTPTTATFGGAVEVNGNFVVDGAGVSTDFQLRRSLNAAALLTINAPGGSPNGSVFSINGNSVMTLDANQNATFAGAVGIGGTTPSNGYMIDITPTAGNIIRSTRGTSVFGAYQSNNSDVYLGTISNNTFKIITNDGTAITIGADKNATFAGMVTTNTRFNASTQALHFPNYSGTQGWQIGSDSTADGMYLYNENGVYAMKLTKTGNATFAGSINTSGSINLTNGGVNTIAASNSSNGYLRFLVDQQGVALTLNADTTSTFGGIIYAVDGNKATPGYSFASDPDTGMFRDSANVLVLGVNGDTRIRITNSDIVTYKPLGVNTTSITSGVALDVGGVGLIGDSGVGDFYLGNYATANHFRFHTNNSNTYFDMNCGDIYWRQGTSTRYQFFASTANMTIQGTLTQNSDARTKENVIEISDCISKVKAMRGVYYNRTDFNTEVTKVGVIAQEVEAVLPELVLESPETGLKSVAYSELTSVLINAIKEQQEIIEDLKTRITKLEN